MGNGARDAAWAIASLEAATAALRADAVAIGGKRAPPALPGDARASPHPHARLVVTLAGSRPRWISVAGSRQRFAGGTGAAVFLAPRAWELLQEAEASRCLAVVLAPRHLRIMEARIPGRTRAPTVLDWHHTAAPLGGPALAAGAALAQRTASGAGGGPADAHLMLGLLHLAAQHCRDRPRSAPRGLAAWQAFGEILREEAHEELSRDGVARRLGLHPTYFSELCVRHGGGGFHRLLEEARLERVRRLLAAGDGRVGAIAAACGFRDVGVCIRAFRRRFGTTPLRWRAGRPRPPA